MTVTASCHCGAIRLRFPALDLASARRCDCSLCRRKGAVMVSVPRADLVVEAGDALRRYQFGTMTAEHYFCGVCGIYTHHRRRSNPEECGVNLGCVEGADMRAVEPVAWFDGVNHPSDREPG
ncbi:MAG: GFA family protein [Rubrimonas sp.]|uniref:GFA family protein n=1 Tax=Rubrimonas sp. TaxID=2036015 RepID=UPI002FDC81E3